MSNPLMSSPSSPHQGRRMVELIWNHSWDDVIARTETSAGRLEAATTDDGSGDRYDGPLYLPIHVACNCRAPADVMEALIRAFPKGTETASGFFGKHLPLHMACVGNCGFDVVHTLLNAYPPAARTADGDGCYPLHLSLYGRGSVRTVREILDACPEAALKRDHDDFLPLHIELMGPRDEAVLALIDVYPDAARIADSNGDSWSSMFLQRMRRPRR